jgi:MSHA pilin protein MshC
VTDGPGGPNGFTLFEVVFVLTLMAVITAIYVGQFKDSNVELIADLEALKAHLRHAQARAMSTSKIWYIRFSPSVSPTAYALYRYVPGGSDESKVFPGESGASVQLSDGITIGVGTSDVLSFDRLGRPFTNPKASSALAGVWTIATSTIGNVAVMPGTGYIP